MTTARPTPRSDAESPRTLALHRWPIVLLAVWVLLGAALRITLLRDQGLGSLIAVAPMPGIILYHLVAELCMATVPALGAVAWWRGARWGAGLLIFGLGLQVYAVANATGWAVVNHLPVLVVLQGNLAVDLLVAAPLVLGPGRAGRASARRRALVAAVLVLLALQIYGLWTMFFATGEVSDVAAPRVDTGVLLYRELGELGIVALGLAGAWGWSRARPWGAGIALFALGMLCYAALNTMSHSALGSPPRMIFHVATVAVAVALLPHALRSYDADGISA